MTDLGPDWIPDEEGIPHRRAARVIVFAPDGRILLIHGHDGHGVHHQWWFTVGGGIEPGEAPEECAIRELFEETGIKADTLSLVGPVLSRKAEFVFLNVRARQDELFFLLFLSSWPKAINPGKLTKMEEQLLDQTVWLLPSEITKLSETEDVYPSGLGEMSASWWSGWDGVCKHICEGESSTKKSRAANDATSGL